MVENSDLYAFATGAIDCVRCSRFAIEIIERELDQMMLEFEELEATAMKND